MVDTGKRPYRKHKCNQGHEWIAQVVLSSFTPSISGERKQYCPQCEQMAVSSSPWINEDGTPYPFQGLRK